jgi:N-acyl-D-amino-acid deacylase
VARSADVLLRDGLVYPGEAEPIRADVAIAGRRIVGVGQALDFEAANVIELDGLAVAPGFVDMHSHCALRPFVDPALECKITQGFTTELVNQDGVGPAPVTDDRLADRRAYLRVFEGEGPQEWPWRSIDDYLAALDDTRPATSLCPLVPHGAVRDTVMGGDRRAPTATELDAMCSHVREGMQAGAWGLSFGLIYTPAAFADTRELVALARVAAEHDGFLIPHIRSESSRLLEAVSEMVAVARLSGAALNLTHLKVLGKRNAGLLPRLLELIDEAVDEGLDVTFDQYPYTAGATTLTATLPLWAHEGGPARMLARLRDRSEHARLVADMWDEAAGQENHLVQCGADAITIVDCGVDGPPDTVGRTLAALAEDRAVDPAQAAIDLLVECRLQTTFLLEYADEATVRTIAAHPRMLIGSDGIFSHRPHPRLWGTAPRLLGHYALREGVIDAREAIARLSSRAAARIGLSDRGRIEAGLRADLVVFDPDRLIDRATYANPAQPAAGIAWVFVGGRAALDPAGPTGVRAGGVVRRRAAPSKGATTCQS